jgi:cytoskeletal protein CcmA (bactofilin family)
MIRRLLLLGSVALLFWPVSVAAQSNADRNDDDVLVRVNGPITIQQGEELDTVVGVRNDVTIDGTVRDALVVVDGSATVNGRVDSEVFVVRGTLNLGPTAVVKDVTLIRSDLNRDPAATVTGDIHERSQWVNVSFGWGSFIFSFLFWLSFTIVILVAGILFAVFGARQLVGAAAVLTGRPGPSLLTALILWIGLPILAVLALFTVIGIPLGIVTLVFLMPVLWFLGYLVAGTLLGLAIVRTPDPVAARGRLVLAAIIGLLIFQIVGLVPFIGGLIVFLAGWLGSGALVYLGYRGVSSRQPAGAVPPATVAPAG